MPRKERVARKKLAKQNFDLTVPITLEQLGNEEDPCFGKLYDPRTPECKRCGDSELCAIALSQHNHIKRLKVEKKVALKDVEEGDIPKKDPKQLRKEVRGKIVEIIKDHKQGIKRDMLVENVYGIFNMVGIKKSLIIKLIKRLEVKNKHIIEKNNLYKWKT
jgi:hypothetical protein